MPLALTTYGLLSCPSSYVVFSFLLITAGPYRVRCILLLLVVILDVILLLSSVDSVGFTLGLDFEIGLLFSSKSLCCVV
ncbi:hypothetical protein N658DRAFT_492716 [Parathielavia hyrcaniae]|uniref:Uncharacterized protein n=1 Tax=Parathielavia hyrcaniae TaxID=113614 RepID=A0AAN6QCA9_9PEZI|nr:hypothetical protein N658DRAFT_492716 [Parathielavia hyrcaniae]